MATRTFTTAGVDNLWSNVANWDTGVPVSGDAAVIPAGQTCVFDVDQSGFASGLLSLTINGLLDASTAAGAYYLKMAGNITAATAGGILRAGSSGTPYPSGCTFTIFMNGNFQILCVSDHKLTLQLYCYDPPIRYARLISATSKAITSITLSTITTIGCTSHGYSVGNTIFLHGILGTIELNTVFEVATVPDVDSFTIRWPETNVTVDSSTFTAYVSGGLVCPQTAEASSSTAIEIDQDVSADAEWTRAGALVRIDNINKTLQSEQYTISSVSLTAITLSSGLTNAKLSGSFATLVTRNIKILSSATAISNGIIRYSSGSIIRAEIRPGNTTTNGIQDAVGATLSGAISSCASGVSAGSGHTISGVITGCATGILNSTDVVFSGLVSGCTNDLNGVNGLTGTASAILAGAGTGLVNSQGILFAGLIIGCNLGATIGNSNIMLGIITFCITGISTGFGHRVEGLISGCTTGISAGAGFTIAAKIYGCLIALNLGVGLVMLNTDLNGNTTDVTGVIDFVAYNTFFGGSTEFSGYNGIVRGITVFAESFDHDQVANAYRAWCRGGIIDSDTGTVYSGRTRSYKHACESASYFVFQNRTFIVEPGGGLVVQCYVRKSATMAYLPRVWILTPGQEPFITGSPAFEDIMTDSVDTWEELNLVYANGGTSPVSITVRTLAKNATGNAFFDPIVTVLAPISYDIYNTFLTQVALIVSLLPTSLTTDGYMKADVLKIEGVDPTNQIRDSILTDATRFPGADIAAIEAKTDNLPTDPADESSTQAAITVVLAAIAALNNPSTAAIVTAIFAGLMEGRAFEEIIKDIWAQVVGDFVADDADDPASIVYEGPNGATQLTHTITDTTRSWS